MKNKIFLTIGLFSILTFTFTACEKTDDDEEREANATLIFNENDSQITSWNINIDFVTEYDNGIHIQWLSWDENSDRVLYLELGGPVDKYEFTTGTFYHNTSMADIKFEKDGIKYNTVDDGVVTVTSVDKGSKTVSGTFEFKINTTVLDEPVNIDGSGEFTNLPY